MLYTYILKNSDVLTAGLKAPVLLDKKLLSHYAQRAGTAEKDGILAWLETVFPGRSRAVSCLTEPVPVTTSVQKLNGFVALRDCFVFPESLTADTEIVESIWMFDGDTIRQVKRTETHPPLNWATVRDDDNVFFKRIRHYMLVLKNGFIPPRFIGLKTDHHILSSKSS